MDNNISFSKIVATPTLNSWSQAYNAGKLFAVLSLEKTQELNDEIESLNMLGKDLLERLEQEFFVIEDKNLESIKKAVCAVFENEIKGIAISFAAGAFINNVLYLFSLGNARVFIKRDGNLGMALNSEDAASKNVISSSGFLKDNDLIVLATDAFSQVINQNDLDLSLNDTEPSEITESLAPKIHKSENGNISAIVIKYKNQKAQEIIDEDQINDESIQAHDLPLNKPGNSFREGYQKLLNKYFSFLKSKLKSASWRTNFKIQPTKKFFLAITIIIVCILIFSTFLAVQKQNNAKIKALFENVYQQALKKYDDGQSLADMNKNLARDSFLAAETILKDNRTKFREKSKEYIQIQDLLKKIDDGLSQVSPIDKSGLDRSTLSIAIVNGSGIEGAAGKAANILKAIGYNNPSTGNADKFDYEGVTIKVKSEKSKFADLLKKDLSKDYTIKSTSSDLSPNSPTDVLIIIGK